MLSFHIFDTYEEDGDDHFECHLELKIRRESSSIGYQCVNTKTGPHDLDILIGLCFLSNVCTNNTGMPGDVGRTTLGTTWYIYMPKARYFHRSKRLIRYPT